MTGLGRHMTTFRRHMIGLGRHMTDVVWQWFGRHMTGFDVI